MLNQPENVIKTEKQANKVGDLKPRKNYTYVLYF